MGLWALGLDVLWNNNWNIGVAALATPTTPLLLALPVKVDEFQEKADHRYCATGFGCTETLCCVLWMGQQQKQQLWLKPSPCVCTGYAVLAVLRPIRGVFQGLFRSDSRSVCRPRFSDGRTGCSCCCLQLPLWCWYTNTS